METTAKVVIGAATVGLIVLLAGKKKAAAAPAATPTPTPTPTPGPGPVPTPETAPTCWPPVVQPPMSRGDTAITQVYGWFEDAWYGPLYWDAPVADRNSLVHLFVNAPMYFATYDWHRDVPLLGTTLQPYMKAGMFSNVDITSGATCAAPSVMPEEGQFQEQQQHDCPDEWVWAGSAGACIPDPNAPQPPSPVQPDPEPANKADLVAIEGNALASTDPLLVAKTAFNMNAWGLDTDGIDRWLYQLNEMNVSHKLDYEAAWALTNPILIVEAAGWFALQNWPQAAVNILALAAVRNLPAPLWYPAIQEAAEQGSSNGFSSAQDLVLYVRSSEILRAIRSADVPTVEFVILYLKGFPGYPAPAGLQKYVNELKAAGTFNPPLNLTNLQNALTTLNVTALQKIATDLSAGGPAVQTIEQIQFLLSFGGPDEPTDLVGALLALAK